jgi:hypothetical protein
VAVRHKTGKPIAGLAAEISSSDNGVRQEISEVTYGTKPIDVTVALDVSASVTGQALDDAARLPAVGRRSAARRSIEAARVSIGRSSNSDFTSDAKAVEAALRGLPASGRTGLYDTMSTALVTAPTRILNQLVVILTDGSDTGSITTPGCSRPSPIEAARRSLLISSATTMFECRRRYPTLGSARSRSGSCWCGSRRADGDIFGVEAAGGLSLAFRRALAQFRMS